MKTSARHVLPIDDVIEHVEDEDCVCGPQKFVIRTRDGGRQRVARHHSLREPNDDEVA